jgi:exopolysaccharide biosynthesis polyprenyl glycosylphosphotransferase
MTFTLAFLEAGSVFVAVCLLMGARSQPSLLDTLGVPAVIAPALSVSLCCLVSFYYHDLHDTSGWREARSAAPRLRQSLGLTLLAMVGAYALLPGETVSVTLAASAVVAAVALAVPLRAASQRLATRRGLGQRVLILGSGALARKIANDMAAEPHPSFTVVGLVDDGGGEPEGAGGVPVGCPVMKADNGVDRLLAEVAPDRLVVALGERRGRLPVWGLLSSCAAGLRVEDGIDFYERLTRKLAIESLSPSVLIFQHVLQKSRALLAAHRVLSLLAAVCGLVLCAPLLLVIAVLVKLDSPGPVFFVQERVGLRGRIFRLIKFRTMQGAPPAEGSVWSRDDEPRLTRLGRRLRDLHLDELPQFINILKGDMDLVGPRPEMACNVQTMTEHIPYYWLRHTVRPGVTGWAQVKQGYCVSQAEVTEKMRYDLYYIKHLSLRLDLRIVLATLRILVCGRPGRAGRAGR